MVSLLLGEAPITAVFCTWVWLFKILESLTAESGILLAPVRIGQVALKDIAGTGADLIVTKHVDAVH
jgi:CxxC motif-containing protein